MLLCYFFKQQFNLNSVLTTCEASNYRAKLSFHQTSPERLQTRQRKHRQHVLVCLRCADGADTRIVPVLLQRGRYISCWPRYNKQAAAASRQHRYYMQPQLYRFYKNSASRNGSFTNKKKGIWRRLRIKELMGVPVLPEASRINMLGHVSFAIANRFAATFGLNARCFQKLFEMHSASGPRAHGNNQAGILNPTAFWQFNQNNSVLCFLILPE